MNNKVVKLAMRSAVSAKLADDELFAVDAFEFAKPSTKDAKAVLAALGIEGRVTIVVDDTDINAFLSFRNLENVRIIACTEANTYDLMDNAALLMTKDAVVYIEEVLS